MHIFTPAKIARSNIKDNLISFFTSPFSLSPLFLLLFSFSIISLSLDNAFAVPTNIKIHVKSKDAKFIGSEVGGAAVQIFDFQTGQLLSQGVTQGNTGDTRTIMETPRTSRDPITDENTAKFVTTLDIDQPTWVRIVARGPLAYPRSVNTASVSQWVFPGEHLDQGDGIILEIPGLIVDLIRPQFILGVNENENKLRLSAKVAMLCGCPVRPQGMWNSDKMEIRATVTHNRSEKKVYDLKYDSDADVFRSPLMPAPKGEYAIEVKAFDPETGNTGFDRLSYTIR